MTWADYTILGIILVSSLIGLVRGFLREVVSVLIWALGFWLAMRFAATVGAGLRFIHDPSARVAVGFTLIFILLILLGMLVNFLLSKVIEGAGAVTGDRVLGTLFGALRGVVLVGALVLAGSFTSLAQRPGWRDSKLIPYAAPLATLMRRFIPGDVRWETLEHHIASLGPA